MQSQPTYRFVGGSISRPVPDDGDDERADDVVEAALSLSYDASAVYDEYGRAIWARVGEASASSIMKRK